LHLIAYPYIYNIYFEFKNYINDHFLFSLTCKLLIGKFNILIRDTYAKLEFLNYENHKS